MNCGDVERLLDAHLDGELSGSLRLEFEAHRLHCPRCQQMLAMMEACMHVIATDPNEPGLSDGFTDRLMSRLGEHRPATPRRHARPIAFRVALVLQAAAVLLLAFLWGTGAFERKATLPQQPGGGSIASPAGRIDAYDSMYAEVVGALGRTMLDRLEGGATLSQEWASMAHYFNVELPESYALQARDLAISDPFSFFMSALLPSGGSPAPGAPVTADDSFSL